MAESFGVLNTNLAAQQAYFYLQNNTTKLNEASDRVASGLRVKNSQDDPAGYIQITRFKSVIAGLTTAKQNVGSAKSLTGIIDGGLSSIRDLLQEARATALVASDATKSASERNALDATIRQNIQEIDDLVRQTTFGGKILLDGTANFTFQTGANAGDVTQLKVDDSFYAKDLKVGDPGSAATINWATTPSVSTSSSVANATWTIEFQSSGTFTVTNTAVGSSPTATGTVGTAYESQGISFQIDAPTGTSYAKGDRITFTTEENSIDSVDAGTAQGTKGSMTTTAASNYTDTVDGTFTVTVTGDGDATDDGGSGTQLTADYSFIGSDGSTSTGTITLDADTGIGQIGTTGVYVDFSDYDAVNSTDDFKTGDTFTFDVAASKVFAPDETGVIGSEGVTLKSANAAATSITHIDNAIEKIEASITKIGSVQRRLDIKLLSLQTQIRNNDSARSVIEDADVAQEQLNVAKFQILQQTSLASVVAANTQPQSILGLFR
jgi:flagellin